MPRCAGPRPTEQPDVLHDGAPIHRLSGAVGDALAEDAIDLLTIERKHDLRLLLK